MAQAPDASQKLTEEFLDEYSTTASIRRYTKEGAGNGIGYLLDHDYGEIYLEALDKHIRRPGMQRGLRLWEFGCGGGMNLIHLVSLLEARGIPWDCAYGTDFSEVLIEAAKNEANKTIAPEQSKKITFCVARNEKLILDVTTSLGIGADKLLGSFDLLLGVNTIRYSHRLMSQVECVQGIRELLADNGVCVVIDMNNKFPAFRSRLRDPLAGQKAGCYLPSLDEYARPFSIGGFEVIKKTNFCWIPHSAGPTLTAVMRALSPILNAVIPSRAMRSLVISRKQKLIGNNHE